MTADDLRSLLRTAATGNGQRTSACPDEHQIAAYVDGVLEASGRETLELHLADCSACLALVGLLSRERDANPGGTVPEQAVSRARNVVMANPRRHPVAPQWAAAAAVVLSMSVLLFVTQQPGPVDGLQEPSSARATRSIPSGVSAVQVLYPRAGMAVDPKSLTFRWTEVPGSHYYDVRVVNDSGELIGERRVVGTEWRSTGQLALHPGADYFVHVDAYPSEAKSVSSEHVPFSVVQ
ncbi:MAG TPA: zf-HC2 domain-containing protein [Steroidobacteraceae bacterium]|nr:zf-HC2 domain-containing protein [Steroidobacteraceae bacterium]